MVNTGPFLGEQIWSPCGISLGQAVGSVWCGGGRTALFLVDDRPDMLTFEGLGDIPLL